MTRGDRFILRAYSPTITIGGGVSPRSSAAARSHPNSRRPRAPPPSGRRADSVVPAIIEERGAAGLDRQALVSRAGLSPVQARSAIERLTADGRVVAIEEPAVARRVLDDLSARLLAELEAHHRSQPLSAGLPREEARDRLFGRTSPAVFDFAVQQLVAVRACACARPPGAERASGVAVAGRVTGSWPPRGDLQGGKVCAA